MLNPYTRSRQVAPKRSLSLGSELLMLLGALIAVAGIFLAGQDLFGSGLPAPR